MNNPRFLQIVIILLLLIDAGTITYVMCRSKNEDTQQERPRGGNAAAFISKELQFTPAQQKQFDALKQAHHTGILKLDEQSHAWHNQFFHFIGTADTLKAWQIADSIAANTKQNNILTFRHFEQVRAICNPEQQKKFDDIIMDALHMMQGPPPPPRDGQGPPPPDEHGPPPPDGQRHPLHDRQEPLPQPDGQGQPPANKQD